MPFPPPPTCFSCPQCGWQRTIIHESDVLLPGRDLPLSCAKCGHSPLRHKPASARQISLARLSKWLLHR